MKSCSDEGYQLSPKIYVQESSLFGDNDSLLPLANFKCVLVSIAVSFCAPPSYSACPRDLLIGAGLTTAAVTLQ